MPISRLKLNTMMINTQISFTHNGPAKKEGKGLEIERERERIRTGALMPQVETQKINKNRAAAIFIRQKNENNNIKIPLKNEIFI